MIEQRDYVTVNYSVKSKLRICKFPTVQVIFSGAAGKARQRSSIAKQSW